MTFNWIVFLLGLVGGFLAELLKWYELKTSTNLPAYLHSLRYWIITILMAAAGGFLAVIYGIDATKPLLAVNIGLTAPLVLKGLAALNPVQTIPPAGAAGVGASTPQPAATWYNFIAGR